MTTAPGPETIRVNGGRAFEGSVTLPGDKSISHRVLLLGAAAAGTSPLAGPSHGDDVRRTVEAVGARGAEVEEGDEAAGVQGGRSRLHSPNDPIDLGNSGTGMRLLLGVVAGLPVTANLTV